MSSLLRLQTQMPDQQRCKQGERRQKHLRQSYKRRRAISALNRANRWPTPSQEAALAAGGIIFITEEPILLLCLPVYA